MGSARLAAPSGSWHAIHPLDWYLGPLLPELEPQLLLWCATAHSELVRPRASQLDAHPFLKVCRGYVLWLLG